MYPQWPGSVGLEIEMLPLQMNEASPKQVPLYDQGGLSHVLAQLAKKKFWTLIKDPDERLLKIQLELGDYLTFEPGGQLEFSTIPYPCLSDAVKRISQVQSLLDQVLQEKNVSLFQFGINPFFKVEEIGLQMSKARYRAMDHYFSNIGPFGQRMMRQTCTIQPCLDFGPSEHDMAKRYLVGQLLAPFATALFSYSSWVDHADSGYRGFRSLVWRKLDATRTGLTNLHPLLKQLNKAACVDSYLEFALDANVVFIEGLNYEVPQVPMNFAYWMKHGYKGVFPSRQDFETHLSLLFPEVRPRGFLEFRSIDCQSREWQIVPAAFYLGLLYDENKLEKTLELLTPYSDKVNELLEYSVNGLEHSEIRKVALELMDLSLSGFSGLPPCFRGEGMEARFKSFSELFSCRGLTPADALKQEIMSSSSGSLCVDLVQSLEHKWKEYRG